MAAVAQASVALMFERLVERAEQAGKRRAAAIGADLAERMGSELPDGVEVEATTAGCGFPAGASARGSRSSPGCAGCWRG
jgi:hypothetical protein